MKKWKPHYLVDHYARRPVTAADVLAACETLLLAGFPVEAIGILAGAKSKDELLAMLRAKDQ